jgi:hypothetical protein
MRHDLERDEMTERSSENSASILSGEKRRKKAPHALHLAKTPDRLLAALEAVGIDLIGLVFEFVKPNADPGIIVTGSIANGIATEASDLDIIVLLPALTAMKKRQAQIGDVAVNYMPHEDGIRTEITMIVRGIDININFIADARACESGVEADGDPRRAAANMEDHYQMRFLGRLGNSWVLRNESLVKRWRVFYETDKFRINRIGTEFTAATKNLEDMRASIGKGPGCVGILGISIVSKAMQSLLAYGGFSFVSGKWLRKANEMIADPGNPSATLLAEGRRLLFPGLFATESEEEAYFREVQMFCRAVRAHMSQDEIVSIMLDEIVETFDVML